MTSPCNLCSAQCRYELVAYVQVDIRKAYRNLALRLHPDKNNGKQSNEFNEIQTAYEVLGDPESRRRFDARYLAERGDRLRARAQRPSGAPSSRAEYERWKAGRRGDNWAGFDFTKTGGFDNYDYTQSGVHRAPRFTWIPQPVPSP